MNKKNNKFIINNINQVNQKKYILNITIIKIKMISNNIVMITKN